ncbi:hypothetical protein ACMXLF_001413 [Vibrio alginolyticus]|uniref:hypothetical protein n=1 Tax=Vibrio alginolyticus TaxID=663 RepID=UPI001EFDD1C5|nr:hypothetical protein [Vibrio alginolyticus]
MSKNKNNKNQTVKLGLIFALLWSPTTAPKAQFLVIHFGVIVLGLGAQQFVYSMMPKSSVGIIGYSHRPFINFQEEKKVDDGTFNK